ncbi:MAG: 4Fe-4S binding protein [Proteobacteria bacterium]|nr:4Fe-4S binding protein [Pseudomonadota bacterium]
MAKRTQNTEHVSYVYIDESLCNGCVLCMKACPTKAIRVKEGRMAQIQGYCINCGECTRVCPRRAISAVRSNDFDLSESGEFLVSPCTALYTQFGEDVLPNDILLGLKRLGFSYVHDQAYTSEIFSFATELYIRESRKKEDDPFPLISPLCPVVVKLIAYRFPSLLKHILPLATPRELAAREAKKRGAEKYGCKPEEIKLLHITPCQAIADYAIERASREGPCQDKAIGINTIYEPLHRSIQDIDDDRVLHHSGGVGLGWGMSGGEVAALDRNCLAVSGLHETIRYLEEIEMGLLQDVDYVEFRACSVGCLGGPFAVADKYRAKHILQKLVLIFGVERRIKYNYVIDLYNKGWFFSDKEPQSLGIEPSQLSSSEISKGIERQNRVEEIFRLLPKKECGACGAPDCRTFAEDVVDGETSLKNCVFWEKQKREMRIEV